MDDAEKKLDEQVRNIDPSVASHALLIASLSADELEAKGGLQASRKQYICQKAIEIATALKEAETENKKRIANGYSILSEKLQELSPTLQEKFTQEFLQAKERIVEIINPTTPIEDRVGKYLPCNTYQDVLGFSSEMLEWMYQVGRDLFNEKKFLEANGLFRILLSLNDQFPNYWIALGLSEKELLNYEEAVVIFASVIAFAPENPSARYNCAELYLELGQYDDALTELEALSLIIDATGQENLKPQYDALYQRVIQKKQAN